MKMAIRIEEHGYSAEYTVELNLLTLYRGDMGVMLTALVNKLVKKVRANVEMARATGDIRE